MQSFIQDVNTFPNAAVCRRHETFNVTFQQCPLEIYQHYSLLPRINTAHLHMDTVFQRITEYITCNGQHCKNRDYVI